MSNPHPISAFSTMITLSIAFLAHADGFALKGDDEHNWTPLTEKMQRAVIHHEDGIQEMYLAVHLELTDPKNKGLWIFPVPGNSDTIQLSIADRFPRFSGSNPQQLAKNNLNGILMLTRATQLYPIIVDLYLDHLPFFIKTGEPEAVSVEHAVQKWGLRSELIEAESIQSLLEYLETQNVTFRPEQFHSLKDYFNQDYRFVATWIDSQEEVNTQFSNTEFDSFDGRWPCVMVKFPLDKPFFPLKPTAGYGEAKVPFLLNLTGLYVPRTTARISMSTKHNMRFMDYKEPFRHLASNLNGKNDPYTTVYCSAAANLYTDDLHFVPANDKAIKRASALNACLSRDANSLLVVIILTLLLSYCSGGIAGYIQWGKWNRPALLGLLNIFTLPGLALALCLFNVQKAFGPDRKNCKHPRWRFIRNFSVTFITLSIVIQLIGFRLLDS